MAISDAVQSLAAAFSFGILLQAASGSLFVFYSSHGAAIFQDGPRLVLALFLAFAALWAQTDFINLLIPTNSATGCQATLIFSTAFDQLARVTMEQFLLWSVGSGSKLTVERLVLQAVLGIRLVAGGLLVGFTRPEFAPACVARTSVFPISIVVVALDVIIVGVLIVRALSCGMLRDIREANAEKERSRALILIIVGFLVWAGMSVVMLLGISATLFTLRTTVPSNGLLVLVGIVTVVSGASLLPKEVMAPSPGARSPFMTHSPQARAVFRENIGANGSPVVGHGDTKRGSLFVVNPSAAQRDSPTVFQGSQADTKGFTKLETEVSTRGIRLDLEDEPQARRGLGYRGSSGVFPSGFQGAIAPQIRAPAPDLVRDISRSAPPAPAVFQQKRSLFNWSKQPTPPTIRSLKISEPVMGGGNQDPATQPFARMQTIDLATAATNERERREASAARARLVANRPPPRPPLAPQEALRKSINLKRKEMPGRPAEAMSTIASSAASGVSVDRVNRSTSSASLSPRRDEVRRRSPRNVDSFGQSDGDGKPSLQRKQTIGLPSNPRSNRITMARESGMGKQQTVMLMNEIVYDNPGMVKTIIENAPGMYRKAPKTAGASPSSFETTLRSSGSIIHRPRPFRRDSDKDGTIFFHGGDKSPGHRRSKSGPSVVSRKSLFMSQPGSPTQLPPLPPPPTSAAKLTRILSDKNKSMTFDEKIELLFPAPPGTVLKHNRRSSVPSLPRVPSVFISDSPLAQSPGEETHQSQRASKRTTIASFGLHDSHIPDSERRIDLSQPSESLSTYRFSANTYRTLADEVGETWIPGIPSHAVDPRISLRAKTPKDSESHETRKSSLTETSSSNASSHDTTTYWGSIHSRVPVVDLSKATMSASSIHITKKGAPNRPLPPLPKQGKVNEKSIMTVMSDFEEHQSSASTPDNRRSIFLDSEQPLPGDTTPTPLTAPSWHRRIGDELPTFSERKQSTRSRKAPQPTPLLLNSKGRTATVVVRAPEPSPPMDSPGQAIREIQAQLKRLEGSGRGSVGSPLQNMPDAATSTNGSKNDINSRFELLENLENEMGQQENQWQQMQTNLDRNSMSSMLSPQLPVEPTISRNSSQRSRIPRVVSRRARVRNSAAGSKVDDSSSTTTSSTRSTMSSDNSRASVWQQRLAEAQMEYLENAPSLLLKQSVNFLSFTQAQIGSPTPPDSIDSGTDLETESESEEEIMQPARMENVRVAKLWEPALQSPKGAVGRLWTPEYEKATSPISPEPPARDLRPTQRVINQALPIFTNNLWKKPVTADKDRAVVRLWGSRLVRPRSIVTRRVTQRPQRRSRRVTFLPDIVESPQPLPNKRDTLGIFQFPWGEKSDSAVYQPAFNPALISAPRINASLDARSRELEPETEYSSSFFDDYDDDGFEDPESDDDFDETTLWDIASMLKTSDVPSRNSLFPPIRAVIEDYDDDTDFETDSEHGEIHHPKLGRSHMSSLPIQPLVTRSKTGSQLSAIDIKSVGTGSMWSGTTAARETSIFGVILPPTVASLMWAPRPQKTETPSKGLFTVGSGRPSFRTTDASPVAKDMVRTARPPTATTLSISSQSLWSPVEITKIPATWLSNLGAVFVATATSPMMWLPAQRNEEPSADGLFSKSSNRSDYRNTVMSPAAINMTIKPRAVQAPLAPLTSDQLWNEHPVLKSEHHWVSDSSIRPESPSIYSESSSGRSSPASESSSPKSTSTKASSIWGSLRSAAAVSTRWDSNASKRSLASSPVETKDTSNQPRAVSPVESPKDVQKTLRRKPSKPTVLSPVRESRVMASRDIWEAMAPKLKDTPAKKLRKAVASQSVSKTAYRALRHQHRPVVAFRANWDEALAEAVSLSQPRLQRPVATPHSWKAALDEAVVKSQPKVQRSASTPEAWKAALEEAISKGRIQLNTSYDAAVRHPVFFGSSMVSTGHGLHPAAEGYVVRPTAQAIYSVMWVASSARLQTKAAASMWAKTEDKRSSIFGHISDVTVRKARTTKAVDLPVLESATFWERSKSIASERNWLSANKTERVKSWVAEAVNAQEEVNALMWTPEKEVTSPKAGMTVASPSSPDTFAHMEAVNTKKSVAARPRLNSIELFEVKAAETTNWLHATSISSAYNPLPAKLSGGMWAPACEKISPKTSDIFTDFHCLTPRETMGRKRSSPTHAALPRLNSNELFNSEVKIAEPTHWLHSSSIAAKPTTTMWSAENKPAFPLPLEKFTVASPSSADMFSQIKAKSIKKATRLAALPHLNSTELFSSSASKQVATHWLHTTSKSIMPQTWTPSAPALTHADTKLWASATSASATPAPQLFANPHTEPWSRKKRSLEEISKQEIESTELWRNDIILPKSPTHWLVNNNKCRSRVEFRY